VYFDLEPLLEKVVQHPVKFVRGTTAAGLSFHVEVGRRFDNRDVELRGCIRNWILATKRTDHWVRFHFHTRREAHGGHWRD